MVKLNTSSARISRSLVPRHDLGGDIPGQINKDGVYVPTSDEITAFQAARVPWAQEVKYGHYGLYFLCATLFFFLIVNLLWKLRCRYGSKIPLYTKMAALARAFTYPQLPPNRWSALLWTFGPLGPNLILGAGVVFTTCFTFINKYYYYPPYYGSAPLYLRSEWLAMATLPFVYALGSKRNVISVLTGISHEKLQVLHQGAAFNFTYMSLVHTFSAILLANREKGIVFATKTMPVYLSGFVALAPLLVLFFGALPPFRKSFYEAFYWVHIMMAVMFAGSLFWHGYKTLDSDYYMIASIVLFLFGAAWRLVMIMLDNPILHRATATLVDEETLKLTIPTLYIKWTPGQHVFIRFSAIRPLESHPFSMATILRPDEQINSAQNMVFLLKPLSGFTKTLFEDVQAKGKASYKVLIDGPYGGAGHDMHTAALSWFEHELAAIQKRNPAFDIQIYITRESGHNAGDLAVKNPNIEPRGEEESSLRLNTPATEIPKDIDTSHELRTALGRPHLPTLIEEEVRRTQGSLGVACCGPPSMLVDCSNAVTKAQIGILKGVYPEVTEVFLKSESYGW
ncbi:hypothetical protein IAU59_002950 [Kwoniella sp. CBS 9459]